MNRKKLQNLPNTFVGKLLNAVRLFGGYAPFQPFYIEVAVTFRCDLDCPYCYQELGRKGDIPDMGPEEAAILENNISRSFRFKPHIYLFGGEPGVNTHFKEILRYFSDKGYNISFATNALAIEGEINGILSVKGLRHMAISLNPFNLETVSRILAGVKAGVGKISVNCPVDLIAETELDFYDVTRRLSGTGIAFLSFQHSQSVNLRERYGKYADIPARIREMKKKRFDMPVMFFPDIRDRDLEAYYSDPDFPGRRKKCVLPWFDMFIRPDLRVLPCDEVDLILGNAKVSSLRKIWNSPSYRAFRRSVAEAGGVYPICERCCHRQYY
jgi:MoaA/NifB/PqqE/SkfB family radical SAM enzyme